MAVYEPGSDFSVEYESADILKQQQQLFIVVKVT